MVESASSIIPAGNGGTDVVVAENANVSLT